MPIPPIEFLTAANARRLSDPRVMGLDAYQHPYTDDLGAATVAQALARMPEHWKATPVCVAFSRLFAVDQTSIVERGDVVEGHRIEDRRDPVDAPGIEVLLSCGGMRWWTYISRGEIDAFGETGALRRRIVECGKLDFPKANITVNMDSGLTWGSAAVIAKRLREIMDRQPPSPAQRDWYKLSDPRECGPGIAHVRGIEPRPVATVGYDDPTGDDVAADWMRS